MLSFYHNEENTFSSFYQQTWFLILRLWNIFVSSRNSKIFLFYHSTNCFTINYLWKHSHGYYNILYWHNLHAAKDGNCTERNENHTLYISLRSFLIWRPHSTCVRNMHLTKNNFNFVWECRWFKTWQEMSQKSEVGPLTQVRESLDPNKQTHKFLFRK